MFSKDELTRFKGQLLNKETWITYFNTPCVRHGIPYYHLSINKFIFNKIRYHRLFCRFFLRLFDIRSFTTNA